MGREEAITQSFASETEQQNGREDTENVKEDINDVHLRRSDHPRVGPALPLSALHPYPRMTDTNKVHDIQRITTRPLQCTPTETKPYRILWEEYKFRFDFLNSFVPPRRQINTNYTPSYDTPHALTASMRVSSGDTGSPLAVS